VIASWVASQGQALERLAGSLPERNTTAQHVAKGSPAGNGKEMANGLESFRKQEGNPLAGRKVSNNSGGAFYRVSPAYDMLR
jgi:hypothetical protein